MDVRSDDAKCVSSTAFDSDTGRTQAWWTQTSGWVVMDSATARKWPTTTQSPLKSPTKKKTKVLLAANCESEQNYNQSRDGTRINIGYVLDLWRQLQLELGLKTDADGSFPSKQVKKHYRSCLELDLKII